MDGYSSKRSSRDSAENNSDQNIQVCSQVGCSTRLNSMKNAQFGSPSKHKNPKTTFPSPAQRKEIIGSSSITLASHSSSRKPSPDPKKKRVSHLDNDPETPRFQNKAKEVTGKSHIKVYPQIEEPGSSSSGPTTRLVKRNTQRFGFDHQDSGLNNQRERHGGDVVPPSSSVSPESSSLCVRGKKMNGDMEDDKNNDFIIQGISISDSRCTGSSSPGNSDVTSIGTRRLSCRRTRESRDRLPMIESPIANPSSPRLELSLVETEFSLENQFSNQFPANSLSSFSRPSSANEHIRPNMPIVPNESETSRSSMNRDNVEQYNLDGIAEMLIALERIEQEESYEQLTILETNIFLGGLALHDQHTEMRLDIDNMSYEELLALEERMGTVSTAVAEDVLVKCLKKSIYWSIGNCRENEIDIKCSICQEEYSDGEEVGRMSCDHKYHIECINQWLRLKNWCPVCKATVTPSTTPPS